MAGSRKEYPSFRIAGHFTCYLKALDPVQFRPLTSTVVQQLPSIFLCRHPPFTAKPHYCRIVLRVQDRLAIDQSPSGSAGIILGKDNIFRFAPAHMKFITRPGILLFRLRLAPGKVITKFFRSRRPEITGSPFDADAQVHRFEAIISGIYLPAACEHTDQRKYTKNFFHPFFKITIFEELCMT